MICPLCEGKPLYGGYPCGECHNTGQVPDVEVDDVADDEEIEPDDAE